MIIEIILDVLIFLAGTCTGALIVYGWEKRELNDILKESNNRQRRYSALISALVAIAYGLEDANTKAVIAEKALWELDHDHRSMQS